MELLDLSLPTPAENLALDEALLDEADAGEAPRETLRLWEPAAPLVVVGRSSRLAEEVVEAECRALGASIQRRCSGGAAIVAGPGCLMYAVVLSYELRPAVRMIDQAHRVVMERLLAALAPLAPGLRHEGSCDLTLAGRKVSGNSLRCKRTHLLYHGTLLYAMPTAWIARCLGTPPRQPEYRAGRSHEEFVTQLPSSSEALRAALVAAWEADARRLDWPREATARLVAERYSREEWLRQR